jgi:hypothetical protein
MIATPKTIDAKRNNQSSGFAFAFAKNHAAPLNMSQNPAKTTL